MALIKCPQCGHDISDKAAKCPKCGCAIRKGASVEQPCAEIKPNTIEPPIVSEEYEAEESQSSGKGLLWGAVIVVLLLVCGGIGYYFYHREQISHQNELAQQQQVKDSLNVVLRETELRDSLRQDSIQKSEQLKKDICEAYISKYKELRSSAEYYTYDFFGFFLYDLTGDDIPELIVHTGDCEANFLIHVFTYDNRIKKIGEFGADHSRFYKGDGYILLCMAHMGCGIWWKYTFDGKKLKEEKVYEEEWPRDEEGYDENWKYKDPTEEEIYFSSDLNIIKKTFGQE